MVSRFVVTHGRTSQLSVQGLAEADKTAYLDWLTERRNAVCDIEQQPAISRLRLSSVLRDLLDIATAVYLADIAAPRGDYEEWVRQMEIQVPVRRPAVWREALPMLQHLLYTLTRDWLALDFVPLADCRGPAANALQLPQTDCVCLLSGGLDSFAGAAMLMRAGHKPLLVSHHSGNPAVAEAQQRVVQTLEELWPDQAAWLRVHVAPSQRREGSLPFPPPQNRENSRRSRSFLFMSLGAAAAAAAGVNEVYLCENGVLTAALPLTPARIGSMSTRSTHPVALSLFSQVLASIGHDCSIDNPFVNQTKGEVIRTFLKPVIAPEDIMKTVSCWAAGRQQRQCGGCVPCIMRRFATLASGLPKQAYMMDLLERPQNYVGTEAYGNLVDLLAQTAAFLGKSTFEILTDYPQLLDLNYAGVEVGDVIATLKRHAAEVYDVSRQHFPEVMKLLREGIGDADTF